MINFFDTEGRIGIVRMMLATLLTLVILFGCIEGLSSLPTRSYPLIGAVAGLALLGLWCEGARRLHDLGITAWVLVIVAPLIAIITLGILFIYWRGTTAWMLGGGAFAGAALLFLRPGDRSANRFGAPPPHPLARGEGPRGASRLRPILALGFAIAAGTGVGIILYEINDGMREQAQRTRVAMKYSIGAPCTQWGVRA